MRSYLSFMALALGALLCAGCSVLPGKNESVRMLFVGNSLIYVGNLPAVVDALAGANGRFVKSEMIASGGATLDQHLHEGAAHRAIETSSFDYVVLQERGGDILCAFGPQSCIDATASLAEFSRISQTAGARPIYLGTYQAMPAGSIGIEREEAAAAERLPIAHVAVSEHIRNGVGALPQAAWFADDGMHPGADLTLLKAVLVYREIFGVLPADTAFTVEAEMRGPHGTGKSTRMYSRARVAEVLRVIGRDAVTTSDD